MDNVKKRGIYRIQASEMRFLRTVAGYIRPDKKGNENIRHELNMKPLLDIIIIREYKANWCGQLNKMSAERPPLQAFAYNPSGRRDRGRPSRR